VFSKRRGRVDSLKEYRPLLRHNILVIAAAVVTVYSVCCGTEVTSLSLSDVEHYVVIRILLSSSLTYFWYSYAGGKLVSKASYRVRHNIVTIDHYVII
jgi:hypothetical protein